jgi:hypothetical protein
MSRDISTPMAKSTRKKKRQWKLTPGVGKALVVRADDKFLRNLDRYIRREGAGTSRPEAIRRIVNDKLA